MGSMARTCGLRSVVIAAMLLVAQPSLAADGVQRLGADAPSELLPMLSDGRLRQIASGYLFPTKLGVFLLRKKMIWAADDVMADYADHGGAAGEPWIDIFVYRARHSLADEIPQIEQPLFGAWHPALLEHQPQIPNVPADAHSAWFSGSRDGRLFVTGYVVVERDGWFIEARASTVASAGDAWLAAMWKAIGSVDWNGVRPVLAAR